MNREIKFRAKVAQHHYVCANLVAKKGDWITGYYLKEDGRDYIAHMAEDIETGKIKLFDSVVEIETLGQFTGLKDMNGVDIYEGDIVIITEFDYNGHDTQHTGSVKWLDACLGVKAYNCFYPLYPFETESDVEILGNISDNPELLKGDEKEEVVEFWLKPFDKVLVRDEEGEHWNIGIFSSVGKVGDKNVVCTSESWAFLFLLFNAETEKLIGTTDEPDKKYKFMGVQSLFNSSNNE